MGQEEAERSATGQRVVEGQDEKQSCLPTDRKRRRIVADVLAVAIYD
jgi:hypothetical protein